MIRQQTIISWRALLVVAVTWLVVTSRTPSRRPFSFHGWFGASIDE